MPATMQPALHARNGRRSWLAGLVFMLATPLAAAADPEPDNKAGQGERRQYTYSWQFSADDEMAPRGGTTRGPALTLVEGPTAAWKALQDTGLEARERDRRAILAMAGDYRTSFDFIETIGLVPGYEPARPYQSWGTERVYVVADEPDFVSLQHILVTRIRQADDSLSEPFVVKHWRQDWRYEDRELHAFSGPTRWQHERLGKGEAAGRWTQTVYQVDDSPRYEAMGRWVHEGDHSYWQSDRRRRPLPRREFSVRDDYQALLGTHRITITPTGWVQEEDALKLVLDAQHEPHPDTPHLAREAGLSRYERIQDYDFSPGDTYWERTGPFWSEVRDYWDEVYAQQQAFTLEKSIDGRPLFMHLFELAESHADDPAASRKALAALMARALRLDGA